MKSQVAENASLSGNGIQSISVSLGAALNEMFLPSLRANVCAGSPGRPNR